MKDYSPMHTYFKSKRPRLRQRKHKLKTYALSFALYRHGMSLEYRMSHQLYHEVQYIAMQPLEACPDLLPTLAPGIELELDFAVDEPIMCFIIQA